MARSLEAKLKRATDAVDRATTRAMERAADELVRLMKSLVPVEEGDLRASIGWTWGAAPDGATASDSISSGEKKITIYAGVGLDIPAIARWVEFGTEPHSVAKGGGTKAGKSALAKGGGVPHPGAKAHPYFWPAYRAKRKSIVSQMRKEIRKELKKV
ncbi:HK97-gp10 family putative phage morphogenesis protein [Terasakiella pusilla]|uniref:HK97-gp10 family putative phage morphogenesis protein n=1 Tax=Terasakiella pusilla TaxID=64973 RepID=UPI003AA8C819